MCVGLTGVIELFTFVYLLFRFNRRPKSQRYVKTQEMSNQKKIPKIFDIDGMHVIHITNYDENFVEKSMWINCAPKRTTVLIVCL